MSNDYGLLPKRSPDSLDEGLKRRLEIWYDKAYTDDNLFLTLSSSPAVLNQFLGWIRFIYTNESRLDPRMVELCRIRLAARNQCVH